VVRARRGRHAVDHQILSAEREVAEILDQRLDRRATCREYPVEQAPAVQVHRTVPVDEMPMRGIARKPCPIYEEHVEPASPRSIAVAAPAQRAPTTIASYTAATLTARKRVDRFGATRLV